MNLKIFYRTLSVILIMLIIPALSVASAEEITPSAEVKVSFEGWDGEAFENVKANISAVSSDSVVCGIVTYRDNRIHSLKLDSYPVNSDNSLQKELSVSDVLESDTVKVMVWNENLKPLYNGDYERENILYVSETGTDSGNGTSVSPFSSLESAYNTAKTMNCDVTVSVEAGTYNIEKPIEITASESCYSVSFKGAESGETVIDGGKAVGSFREVEGKAYYVADVDYSDGIYELYVNDHRAKLAQTENVYYAASITSDDTYGMIKFSGDKALPFDISTSSDILISTVNEWTYAISPVSRFEWTDSDNQTAYISKENFDVYTLFQSRISPFCFMNSIDFLDSPGEFYHDKENKKLYYYPISGEAAENIMGYIPVSEGLIKVSGAKNMSFENLTFKHGTWRKPYETGYQNGQAECYLIDDEAAAERRKSFPRNAPSWTNSWLMVNPAQIELESCENVVLKNNRFMNMGAGAVKFGDKNISCLVAGNVFYDIGGAAVTIGAPWHNGILFGNMDKITKNISVTNNLIRKTAQILQGSCAITAYYTNSCNISHNDIAESSYSGISLGWGWGNDVSECKDNRISNNKIFNILSDLWDGNHIYTLGNMPGTVVEGNYMGRTDEDCGGGGYYPDQGSMNISVNNNVVENSRNWTYNLTEYNIKRTATADDGTAIYGYEPKNISYSGNFVDFLNKYRLKFVDGEYADKEINGVTQNVLVVSPEYSGYEETPEEILAGFTELSDFSENADAQAIIENAGLESEYKYLENYLSDMELSVDNGIKKARYFDSEDYFEVIAGECNLDGGEGVSYHSTHEWNTRDGCNYGISIGGRYKGIGLGETGNYHGEWVTYDITPEKSGIYNIYVKAGSTGEVNFELSVDGDTKCYRSYMKKTGSYSLFENELLASGIELESGKTYTVKLEILRGASSVASLIFDRVDGELSENEYKDNETTLIASEDFGAYTDADGNYPKGTKLNVVSLNGGEGWSTPWYDSISDPTAGVTGRGQFSEHIRKAIYTYQHKLYRQLEKPIELNEDKVIRVEFISLFQDYLKAISGLELMDSEYNPIFGSGSYSKNESTDSSKKYYLTTWRNNELSERSLIYSPKELFKQNYYYRYVIEIDVNADNKEKIKVKAYDAASSEPESWDVSYEAELGSEPITCVSLNCSNITYFNSLKLNSINITE